MKKTNLKLFYFIISFLVSFEAISEDFFGFEIYEDAKNYISKSFIDNNKFKNAETKKEFYDIFVTDKMPQENKSPYFETYRLILDDNDKIHSIVVGQKYKNIDENGMEICKSVADSIKTNIENKFNIVLSPEKSSFASWRRESLYGYRDNGIYVSINCNHYYEDGGVSMWLYMDTPEITSATKEFYNSL